MDYRPETVALDRIDTTDTTYRISTNMAVDDLKTSISTVGLINPPLLTELGGDYGVISGFRRVAACSRLGWKEMRARILAPNLEDPALARLAIADNAFQRPLNLLESARAVALLASHLDTIGDIATAAGSLGLSDNRQMTEKLLTLSRLPQPVQDAVLDTSLSLPTALEIGAYPIETATLVADLFTRLKPSLSRQREFLDLLKEISRREGTTMEALIREADVAAILDNPDTDRNQKNRQLRDYLRRRRFPHLTRAEENFKSSVKDLRLGPGASLLPPKHFEGNVYSLALPFRDCKELATHRDTLSGLLENTALEDILTRKIPAGE